MTQISLIYTLLKFAALVLFNVNYANTELITGHPERSSITTFHLKVTLLEKITIEARTLARGAG